MLTLLVPSLLAAVVSFGTASWFQGWARRRVVLDVPNARSSHRVPTPRGGGIGIVAGFLAGLGAWMAQDGGLSPRALGWLAGALLVAGVSFVDDLRGLPASVRLATHLVGALLLTLAGVQAGETPLLVALPLAFGWVAVCTNVYNFMDGIDSLAAAQAVVAGLAFAIGGSVVGNPLIAVAGAVLAAGAVGFLPLNLPPARVFMGDVSSTFLGFNFAALPLLANLGVGGARLPLLFGILVLAPFLFDGLTTLGRRMARGERWFEAHRSHYYQRLVQAGLSHGQVSLLYTSAAVLAAIAAVLSLQTEGLALAGISAIALAPMFGMVALTWRLERGGLPSVQTLADRTGE